MARTSINLVSLVLRVRRVSLRDRGEVGGERVVKREDSGAPLPGAPNVGFRVPADR